MAVLPREMVGFDGAEINFRFTAARDAVKQACGEFSWQPASARFQQEPASVPHLKHWWAE